VVTRGDSNTVALVRRWSVFIADNPALIIALRRRDLRSAEMLLRENDAALAGRIAPPLRTILKQAEDDEADVGPDLRAWFQQVRDYQQDLAATRAAAPVPWPLLTRTALAVWRPVLVLPRAVQDLVVDALVAGATIALVRGSPALYEISPLCSVVPGLVVLLALSTMAFHYVRMSGDSPTCLSLCIHIVCRSPCRRTLQF
jgi:hypothetical protein